MEKIQLLERSSGYLQPKGLCQDRDSHVIPKPMPAPGSAAAHAPQNISRQVLAQVCSTHPGTGTGTLLTAGCSLPTPSSPHRAPLCHRQEADFCLKAHGVSEESPGSSTGVWACSKTQPVTEAASPCLKVLSSTAALCTEAASDDPSTGRGHSHGQGTSPCAVLPPKAHSQTAATSEVPNQKLLTSSTAPHQGRALGNTVTLLIQALSPFSLLSKAGDDKICCATTSY